MRCAGIAGFTAPGPDARHILNAMTGALRHRGPDARDTFVDPGIALGHTRLAIIDLAGGAQPRVDDRTRDALVFNGEIYGYRSLADELRGAGVELRDRSDTEILFQLIRREGLRNAIERIDGMFAFAYRDGATGILYLCAIASERNRSITVLSAISSSSHRKSRRCAATDR